MMLSLSSSSLFLFFLLFLLLHSPSVAVQILFQFCGSINYTAGNNYESNLKLLLPSLAANASRSGGYFEDSISQEPDQVYGLVLCRGDINDSESRRRLPSRKVPPPGGGTLPWIRTGASQAATSCFPATAVGLYVLMVRDSRSEGNHSKSERNRTLCLLAL